MIDARDPVGIELFAGCGGLSTGFLDAGLWVAAGFELDARAVDSYNYNHEYRGARGFRCDLRQASASALLNAAGLSRVDFIVGGPPCQPFSIVGKRLGEADSRSDLIDHFVRIVGEAKPLAFLMENVPNLASIDGGTALRRATRGFESFGYSVTVAVLLAAEFGVPQMRRRLFVLGSLSSNALRPPSPTHGEGRRPYVTAKDAIGDLPDAGDFGETGILNHEPTQHSERMLARLQRLKPGRREPGSFHDRLHPDRPSYTLRAGSGNFSPLRPIHYEYDRVITVRESARLQGFTDSFVWPDRIPRLQQYRQVGNAVPPPLAAALAGAMAAEFEWNSHPERLLGDPSSRPTALSMTDDQRRADRASRLRGASLGRRND